MDTTIIILSYNSEKNIKNCFNQINNFKDHFNYNIVFVDNNSSDNTVKAIIKYREEYKLEKKVKIIKNLNNYNQGGSIKIAIRHFMLTKSENILLVHSSGKCKIDDVVNNFFEVKLSNMDVDVIHASRFHKLSKLNNYSKKNIIGNIFFNYLTYLFTSFWFSDSGCGILFASKRAFDNINYECLTNGPQFNPQLNILFKKNKIKITECKLNWSHGIVKTNVKVIKYSFVLIYILIEYFFLHRILKKKNFWQYKNKQDFKYDII